MTLFEHADIVQGTEEWHALRLGMVTASEIGTIITPTTIKPAANMTARAYAAKIAAERITGWADDTYVSGDMERGWDDEPRAIAAYEKRTGTPVTTTGFMVRDDWGPPLGYSPDGLVELDGIVEVKSRQPKKHLATILTNEVPAENLAQVHAGLLVSGRSWCDYISFCGGMPLWVIRVEPDPAWQAALVEALAAFEAAVNDMTAAYHLAVAGLPLTDRVTEEEIRF